MNEYYVLQHEDGRIVAVIKGFDRKSILIAISEETGADHTSITNEITPPDWGEKSTIYSDVWENNESNEYVFDLTKTIMY